MTGSKLTSQPMVPHQNELDDLHGLLTGELSPAREREVADHLADCDACRRELAVVARASAWLQDAARLDVWPEPYPASEPEQEPEPRQAPEPEPEPEPRWSQQPALPPLRLPERRWFPSRQQRAGEGSDIPRRSRWRAAVAAVVLLVVGALGGVAVDRAGSRGPDHTTVALHPVPGGVPVGDATGMADLSATGRVRLTVNGLPTPPGQDFYELWLFDSPSRRMLAVGVLPPDGRGNYSLPPTVRQGYTDVEISLEPNDGNPAQSQLKVLRGILS